MKKNIFLDKNAEKELREFDEEVQLEFEAYFKILEIEGKLDFPSARKVTKDIFEIRIKLKGEYRGFYAYIGKLGIIILHFFRKKTQKTPVKDLEVAQRRLKQYEP
ncbi:type II toxin-antitoxin system RelE/ParE family toxin [Candidatus Curtissbacteria bacterium]|nr:type II toxin-antitoxin system RelE/ParE family toxin [Candidatus Curtissbacteria bacterium]